MPSLLAAFRIVSLHKTAGGGARRICGERRLYRIERVRALGNATAQNRRQAGILQRGVPSPIVLPKPCRGNVIPWRRTGLAAQP